MEIRSVSLIKFLAMSLVTVIVFSMQGCSEYGDLAAITYKLTNNAAMKLSDFDSTHLPKNELGKSPKCLARRGDAGWKSFVGVCIDASSLEIVIYRNFPSKYKLAKAGVTEKLKASEEYRELMLVAQDLEATLKNKKIEFSKGPAAYIDCEHFVKRFDFTF